MKMADEGPRPPTSSSRNSRSPQTTTDLQPQAETRGPPGELHDAWVSRPAGTPRIRRPQRQSEGRLPELSVANEETAYQATSYVPRLIPPATRPLNRARTPADRRAASAWLRSVSPVLRSLGLSAGPTRSAQRAPPASRAWSLQPTRERQTIRGACTTKRWSIRPGPGPAVIGIGPIKPTAASGTAAATCRRLRRYFRSLNIMSVMRAFRKYRHSPRKHWPGTAVLPAGLTALCQ